MKAINVGFTGTRKGMSEAQRAQLRLMFTQFGRSALDKREREFHHGAARGADEQAVFEAMLLTAFTSIVAHKAGKNPLDRNRDIVAACDVLIAAPETDLEVLRSGTWATVRYARAAGKPVVMLSRGRR